MEKMLDYIFDPYCFATFPFPAFPLTRGDRVRIKEGYDGAGEVFYYGAKSVDSEGYVILYRNQACDDDLYATVLADAIEPYPYTREERIERAIEDLDEAQLHAGDWWDQRAALFAILDAGV